MFKFSEMSLEELQDWRDKSKDSQLKKVQKAIDNIFLPPKPRKVRKKEKEKKKRFSRRY